jgi:uncharacterized protein
VRRLGRADYREMPWKDGGGSTTQLLIHPEGASLAGGFLWRISMALVPASGPFSAFPGVDRTLLLVAGKGMVLDHGAHGRQRLDGPYLPVSFSGDWTTRGELLDGPCRDFNVLSARGRIRHQLTLLRSGPGSVILPDAPRRVLVCLEGEVEAGGFRLAPLETLDTADPGPLELRGQGVVAAVAFWEVPAPR